MNGAEQKLILEYAQMGMKMLPAGVGRFDRRATRIESEWRRYVNSLVESTRRSFHRRRTSSSSHKAMKLVLMDRRSEMEDAWRDEWAKTTPA